ncbi:MAG TPA: hypothetical protein VGC14_19250 [Rhizobium sp.]
MPGSFIDRIELQVALDGVPIEGLIHASISTNNCFSADSFMLTFAMGPPPLCDIAFWSSLSSAYIEIGAVMHDEPVAQDLISGMIDTALLDPVRRTIAVEGRDLSASLIDAYRQQDFVNQTASEVVSTIALYHGLIPVVAATSGNVGRYYGDGYTRLSLGQFSRLRSDWDLVVQLARENGCDVFVQGRSLFFQSATDLDQLPVHLSLRELKTIRFEQTLTMSADASAKVQSWDSQNVTSYSSDTVDMGTGTVAAEPAGAAGSQPFLFSAANFTSQQVTDSAGRYLAELSRLKIIMRAEMPWDLRLSPRGIILIDETNSSLDTLYRVDSIERHYSTSSGSSQIIRAVAI